MRHTSRAMSRGGSQRAKIFIRGEKQEHIFPNGIGGGEEGRKRGAMKEELVFDVFNVLKDSKKIIDFLQKDGYGKDFWVWLRKTRKSQRKRSVEVKSSKRGIEEYMKKVKKMAERGEEFICADLLIDVKDTDDFFSLFDRVVMRLEIS